MWDLQSGAQDLWKSGHLLGYNKLCSNTDYTGLGSPTQLWKILVCSNSDKCSNKEIEKFVYYISFAIVFLNLDSSFVSLLPHGFNHSIMLFLSSVICRLCSSPSFWLPTVTQSTCWALDFCFPSLIIPLPPSFSIFSFLVCSFPFVSFHLFFCAMHLFSPPCLPPGYILFLQPVSSGWLSCGDGALLTELTATQMSVTVSSSGLGKLRELLEQEEISLSRKLEVN